MLLDPWRSHARAFNFNPFITFDPWSLERQAAPALVTDDGNNVILMLETPGIPESEIEVSVTGQTLTVKANRRMEAPEGYVVHQQQRRGGSFTRSFRLAARIDADQARAVVRDGLLTVTLPRAAAEKTRSIPVGVEPASA